MSSSPKEEGDAESGDSRRGKQSSRKRSADEVDSADDEMDRELNPAELTSMSRSERKRYREKKRRSDLNREFDQLMTLLVEIDPEVRSEAEERARRGQWKGTAGAQEDNLLSRVDLIGRTVEVLRRLHRENEQRKQIVNQLLHGSAPASLSSQGDDMSRLPPSRLVGAIPDASRFAPLYQSPALGHLIMTSQGPVDSRMLHSTMNPLSLQLGMPPSADALGGLGYQTFLPNPAASSFVTMAAAPGPSAADQLLALRLLQEQNQRRLQQSVPARGVAEAAGAGPRTR